MEGSSQTLGWGHRPAALSGEGLMAPEQSLHVSLLEPSTPGKGFPSPDISSGRRIASAPSSYHEPPQYQHRSLSPHRQYFDFWNSSYLARDSKYIPDNFLSSFLLISFSLKFIFENTYWDDRLFIRADGQYSSQLSPTPHNTHTFLTAVLQQFEQRLIHYNPIAACACSPQQCHCRFVTWVPAGSSGPTLQSHCHSLGHGTGWNGPVQAQQV